MDINQRVCKSSCHVHILRDTQRGRERHTQRERERAPYSHTPNSSIITI